MLITKGLAQCKQGHRGSIQRKHLEVVLMLKANQKTKPKQLVAKEENNVNSQGISSLQLKRKLGKAIV